MINFNKPETDLDPITQYVDRQNVADRMDEKPRDYLGGSVIGNECERHVQYAAKNAAAVRNKTELIQTRTPPANVLRIFKRGYLFEDYVFELMDRTGFIMDGSQDEVSFFDGRVKGHTDGTITGWAIFDEECPVPLPALWEHKALNEKNFKKMLKSTLKDYSETYYAQVQVYMHGKDLKWCLFSYTNVNTMEMRHMIVEYNETDANYYLDRAERIVDHVDWENKQGVEELLGRCTTDPDFWKCRFCDYSEACWGKQDERL